MLIFDTSILCCWLGVPRKETAGPADNRWDRPRIEELLEIERAAQTTFVLPMATLIETGNHISQAPSRRFELAKAFAVTWSPFVGQESG